MKLFVDSLDPTEIAGCVAAKATSGVTTSVALLADAARAAGGSPRDLLAAICGVANGPVCVAAPGGDRDGMLRQAREWASVAANVVVLFPASDDGLHVIRACAAERIASGIAAGTNPDAVLVAARGGAAFVTVPVGKAAGQQGHDAYDVIRKLLALFKTYEVATQVLAAGIRIPTEIIDAAVVGAHAAAAPGEVVRQLDAESTRRADAPR